MPLLQNQKTPKNKNCRLPAGDPENKSPSLLLETIEIEIVVTVVTHIPVAHGASKNETRLGL